MRAGAPSLPALILLASSGAALAAATPAANESVAAIQERLFDRHHEVAVVGGFIPDEDFYHAFPVGLSYTFHFNDNVAWEVARAQYVLNGEKDLKRDLEEDFGVTPTSFDKIQYTVHTSVVAKPSYGKDSLWNRWIVNHETFAVAGIGLIAYERETSQGGKSTENALSLSFGLGRKFFLSRSLCLNLEVRDLVNFKNAGTENNVYLGLGLGLRFDLAPRKPPQDETAGRLRGYLKEGRGDE